MNEWVSKWMSERASNRTNEQTNERTNAFLVAVWTTIRYVTLQFRDRVGASSLRYKNSAEITVLMWEQRLYPVWTDGRTDGRMKERTKERMLFVWHCEHLSDMWLSTLELGTAQLRSVTYVRTEGLSCMVFMPAQKLSGILRVNMALG